MDVVVGTKMVQWNKAMNKAIQTNNTTIGKKSETIRQCYRDLVNEVTSKYNDTSQLQQQIHKTAAIASEIDNIQQSLQTICSELSQLHQVYQEAVKQQQHAQT
mmetsp:Transcript_10244/g.15510  ORF Transcript_10244/g.15510 Transcript_10244/m.15510 type:complete len:103 (+) Transcript_10244:62-370(+)